MDDKDMVPMTGDVEVVEEDKVKGVPKETEEEILDTTSRNESNITAE